MLNFDTQLLMNKNAELSKPEYNWHGKKILIIEDDYVNYLLMHEILSCSFVCLIRAVSLQEAFDMLASGKQFDLMIMNISIPGNENCRSLKRFKLLWPHLRIIAVTSIDCASHIRKCHPTGCDTMISLDIDALEMCAAVNEMFYPVN